MVDRWAPTYLKEKGGPDSLWDPHERLRHEFPWRWRHVPEWAPHTPHSNFSLAAALPDPDTDSGCSGIQTDDRLNATGWATYTSTRMETNAEEGTGHNPSNPTTSRMRRTLTSSRTNPSSRAHRKDTLRDVSDPVGASKGS